MPLKVDLYRIFAASLVFLCQYVSFLKADFVWVSAGILGFLICFQVSFQLNVCKRLSFMSVCSQSVLLMSLESHIWRTDRHIIMILFRVSWFLMPLGLIPNALRSLCFYDGLQAFLDACALYVACQISFKTCIFPMICCRHSLFLFLYASLLMSVRDYF